MELLLAKTATACATDAPGATLRADPWGWMERSLQARCPGLGWPLTCVVTRSQEASVIGRKTCTNAA